MQKPLTLSLEQIMKNTDPYLFVLTISLLLATLFVNAIKTLLSMRSRVIFPLLRIQTGQHRSTLTTSARNIDVIVCPHCASAFDRLLYSNPTTFTQSREAL
jgi:hypothetical protein